MRRLIIVAAIISAAVVGANLTLRKWPAGAAGPGTTERVSVDSAGVQGNGFARVPAISADGRYVAFYSDASNLVAGDTNSTWDVFVRDRAAGTTERVSVDSAGVQGNSYSYSSAISADGRYVAFGSYASNLVAGDTNGVPDVFVRDRATGTTERVSVDSAGVQGNGLSDPFSAAISADGRYVAFSSVASNLAAGDTNGVYDVFVRDRATGTTERVSVDSAGVQGNSHSLSSAISADGRYVAFGSYASNLVAGDTNVESDVFVRDRATGTTERLSVDSAGVQGNNSSNYGVAISADGGYVAFGSDASNIVTGDTNGATDVFVRDRAAGTTQRVSVDSADVQGNNHSSSPYRVAISADGRYVSFYSQASNLVASDTNVTSDVFVRDRATGTTERVSVDSAGVQGNSGSSYYGVAISADGRYAGFGSDASNLVAGDTNGVGDVFVRDRCPDGSCGGPPPTPTPTIGVVLGGVDRGPTDGRSNRQANERGTGHAGEAPLTLSAALLVSAIAAAGVMILRRRRHTR